MKKTYFLFLLLGAMLSQLAAAVPFEAGKRYRITCNAYTEGALVLGANHGSSALLYYDTSATASTTDAWWYIAPSGNGYTVQNVQSGDYLYYEGTREEGVAKGIRLGKQATADTYRWTFHGSGQSFYVRNVAETAQYFNVRVDGSYLVGTYTGNGTGQNELFVIYDEEGRVVTEDGTVEPEPIEGTQGVTAEGEFWELTGVEQPVVFTTDSSDPVLYHITNVRSGKYLYSSSYSLQQTASVQQAGRFYFVQGDGGAVNVYTSTGQYVETYSWSGWGGNDATSIYLGSGTTSTSENLWALSFYNDAQYPGYALRKTTDIDNWSGTTNVYWNDYQQTSLCFYSLDGGSTFRFSSDDERHLELLLDQGVAFEGYTPAIKFWNVVDSLRFDEKDLVFRRDTRSYLFNVRPKYRNGDTYTARVEVRFKDPAAGYELTVDGQKPDAEGHLDFPAISGLKDYELQVRQGGEVVCTARLNFTFLPIVEINMPSCNSNEYTTGSIRVNFFQDEGYDSTYIAAFKYRGASAQAYEKKSYAVKLRDAEGNSVDREFLNYRSDNNWILDAMAVDKACMRNRVSTDLWNDFAHEPYHQKWEQKARTGTRGRFVEVLLNGSYHGIYCMTEKMDRKQLKLKKLTPATSTTPDEIHGSLYKSSQWSYSVFFGHNTDDTSYSFPASAPTSYNNNSHSENWDGSSWEIKYPDYEEQPIDWAPLWNAVNFVATSNDERFSDFIGSYLDYPVLKDYYLFIELMLASDNHGKNMFYYCYDQKGQTESQKLGIAPWDLDGTWGMRWDGSYTLTGAEQDFATFLDRHEHGQLSYFYRLAHIAGRNWSSELKARYAELRSNYFDVEELCGRFEEYADIFAKSGADLREQNRWPSLHSNIQDAVDYTTQWIRDRVAYLDQVYGYTPSEMKAPSITTTSLPSATAGEKYTALLLASGDGIITWSLSSGTLPEGISVSKSGKLSGTPTEAGTYSFDLTATSNYGSDTRSFTLTVEPGTTDGINTARESRPALTARGGKGCIHLVSEGTQTVTAYTAGGVRTFKATVRGGSSRIDGVPAGIYVVNGQKVIVR